MVLGHKGMADSTAASFMDLVGPGCAFRSVILQTRVMHRKLSLFQQLRLNRYRLQERIPDRST
jgi:hypothetical protein